MIVGVGNGKSSFEDALKKGNGIENREEGSGEE